jgi:hypothetical protein
MYEIWGYSGGEYLEAGLLGCRLTAVWRYKGESQY